MQQQRYGVFLLVWLVIGLAACVPAAAGTPAASQATDGDAPALVIERAPDVPDLPFPENADPLQCGIPQPWGSDNQAWLSGLWQGELVQPVVYLYDSHLRTAIAAQAPHNTEVRVKLFQANPTLNYYLVEVVNAPPGTPDEGWVPAPFLSFEPPASTE